MADWTLPNSVDDLTPHSQYLFERLGMAKRSQQALDTAAQDAMRGTTPDMAKVQARLAELQNQLTQVAQQSIHLPREDFDRLKQQMFDAFSQQVPMPQRQNPQAPNLGQSLAAGLGAILDPRHAASIAATPYQYQNQRAEQGYQDSMAQYGEAQRQKQNAVGFYGDMLNLQDRQDRAVYDQAQADREMQLKAIQGQISPIERQLMDQQNFDQQMGLEQFKQQNLNDRANSRTRIDALKSLLSKVAPENRPAIIGQMGLGLDDAALQAMDELTPQEASTVARTQGVNLDNAYKGMTLMARVKTAYDRNDLDELRKVGAQYSNDLAAIRKQYLPQEYNAKIAKLNSDAAKANKGSDSLARGVTATSWFNAVNKHKDAFEKNTALADAYGQEAEMYSVKMQTETDAKKLAALEKAQSAATAKRYMAEQLAKAAQKRMEELGNDPGGTVQPFKPDTSRPGFGLVPNYQGTDNIQRGPIGGKKKGRVMSDAEIAKKYGL